MVDASARVDRIRKSLEFMMGECSEND